MYKSSVSNATHGGVYGGLVSGDVQIVPVYFFLVLDRLSDLSIIARVRQFR